MMKRLGFLILSCLATFCSATPVSAELLFIGRGAIDFKQGPGFCHVNPDWSEAERLVVDSQRRANAGLNDVVAIFAPCAEVERLRDGQAVEFHRYAVLLTPVAVDGPRAEWYMPRSKYLSMLAARADQGIDLDAYDIQGRTDAAMAVAGVPGGTVKLSEIEQLGMLHRNDDAVFVGLRFEIQDGNRVERNAAVSAGTLIGGLAFQYTLYDSYRDEGTYNALLKEVEQAVRDTVAVNDPTGEPAMVSVPHLLNSLFGSELDPTTHRIIRFIVIAMVAGFLVHLVRWSVRKVARRLFS